MKKILLFGPEVTDFLNPLANKLKQLGYTVDLIENRKIPRNNISITESYSTVLNFQEIVGKRISVVDIIKYLFKKEFFKITSMKFLLIALKENVKSSRVSKIV